MQPLLDLGYPQSEITNLLASFNYDVFPADSSFVGREEELDNINNAITNNVVVLVGIGGIGKSETARKYCELQKNKFDGNVIWLNATTTLSLEQSFRDVATSLGLDTKSSSNQQLSMDSLVNIVQRYFTDDKVLFVFDNCTSATQSHVCRYSVGNNGSIITSQLSNWSKSFYKIDIDTLTTEQAKLFLSENLDDETSSNDTDSINGLLSTIENHTLAMQHAVAYMRELQMNINDYVKLLESHLVKLLSASVTMNQGVSVSVIGCLDLTLQQIKPDRNAYKLFSIISFLDGKYIQKSLPGWAFDDEFDFCEALRKLVSYSVVKCHPSQESASMEDFITIHSLYQTAMRADQQRDKTLESCVADVLYLFFHQANEGVPPRHVDFGKSWYKHLLFILENKDLEPKALEIVLENQFFAWSAFEVTVGSDIVLDIWKKLANRSIDSQANVTLKQFVYNARLSVLNFESFNIDATERGTSEKREKLLQEICADTDYKNYSEEFLERVSFYEYLQSGDLGKLNKPTWLQDYLDVQKCVNEGKFHDAIKKLDLIKNRCMNRKGLSWIIWEAYIECYGGLQQYEEMIKFCEGMFNDENVSVECMAPVSLKLVKYYTGTEQHKKSLIELERTKTFMSKYFPMHGKDFFLQCHSLKCESMTHVSSDTEFVRYASTFYSDLDNIPDDYNRDSRFFMPFYSWLMTCQQLPVVLKHVTKISTRMRPDDESKWLFDILMNDCLIANGCLEKTTRDVVDETIKKTRELKLSRNIRNSLVLKFSERGRYYYALKILKIMYQLGHMNRDSLHGFILLGYLGYKLFELMNWRFLLGEG